MFLSFWMNIAQRVGMLIHVTSGTKLYYCINRNRTYNLKAAGHRNEANCTIQ